MARADDDDRAAIDRAFAEMVAGYHLTADRPDPLPAASAEAPQTAEADDSWADSHPLFAFPPPTGEPVAEPESPPSYVPEPMPPMPRPRLPVLVGWIGIAYAILMVLAAAFGLQLPIWAGWLAVGSFIAGFGILVTQLPRHRPPDAGDGAVL